MRYINRLAALMAAFVVFTGVLTVSAEAQSPPKPGQNVPSQTTSTYGNWVLRCLVTPDQTPSKACEIYQQVQAVKDGQRVTLLTVAVGRGQPVLPLRVTTALPGDVLLSTGPRIRFSDTLATELVFERCIGGACFASANATDEFLKAMRGPADGVRVMTH